MCIKNNPNTHANFIEFKEITYYQNEKKVRKMISILSIKIKPIFAYIIKLIDSYCQFRATIKICFKSRKEN